MKVAQKVNVFRVGFGDVVDEKTGELKPWAKVYCLDRETSVRDDIFGLPESHYSILGLDGEPDKLLASRIQAAFKQLNPQSPIEMEFDFSFKNQGKKSVLAIVGMPSKSGVKQSAAKAS